MPRTANRQTLVSLTLARGEVPVMLALRLFLPGSWTSKRARLERAGVPAEYRTARTKPEMALTEIDRVIAAGVRFGCVLADAGYGLSAPFRQGLTDRKLAWAVGIPRHLKVYPADVQMIRPVPGRGRERIFSEKVSGVAARRPELERALDQLEAGDVLVVTKLDRLARSTLDLLRIIDLIGKEGAGFKSLGDPWADTTSAHGRLMLTVLSGIAEFERSLILQR